MRRNVLLICLSLLLGCSKENRQDVSLSHLRDSLGVLMQYGILHKDTTMLQQALQLSDSLLQIDTVSWNRYIIYYNRSSIYTELGNIHEAMVNKKKAIMLLPSDNIERQMKEPQGRVPVPRKIRDRNYIESSTVKVMVIKK